MPRTEPTIPNYDARTAAEITQRLRRLSQADLAKLEAYEKQGQGRSTVLEAIAALRGVSPWSGYDDMEVEEVNASLKQRDGDTAGRVLEYERRHKGRTTVVEFAKRRQDASDGSSAAAPREAGKDGSKARPRAQSSKSASRPKRRAKRTSSAFSQSQEGSKSGSASRSPGGRSPKAASSRTRAKNTPRPSATRSSGSQQPKSSQRGSRPRSGSSSASQSRPQTRDAVSAKIRQRATETPQSARGRAKKLAENTQRAAGSAARNSRDAVGTAVEDTGPASQSAAHTAKIPALVGGAVLAALAGGIALAQGSKVKLHKKKRVLGVPVPRRTAFGKMAKQMSNAVDGAGSAGKHIAEWSDGLQELRERIVDSKSGPAAVAQRVLS